jgi:selenide,water dikinase
VLRPLEQRADPNLLVGLQTSDDAAVYLLSDELALVQTVDFFPPVVDDPYTYGAIAAANALSDIYAMGGQPLLALNIAAWPEDRPLEYLTRIFEGGADKAAEAGIVVAGGHTVTDDEPKYGMVVTGRIHPQRVLTKAGAQPGDLIYLTKPIGTGVITTALKAQKVDPAHLEAAVASMLRLNRRASQLVLDHGAHACTDVTGYGLIGHATEVALKSRVRLVIGASDVPLLEGAEGYARQGFLPGGARRNRAYFGEGPQRMVTRVADVPEVIWELFFDPVTSGGLLVTVPREYVLALEAAFQETGEPLWRIGRVEEGIGLVVLPRLDG